MTHVDQAALVALGVFIVGLVYDAGRKAERLAQLEKWQAHMDSTIATINNNLAEIKGMIRGEVN